MPSYSPIRCYFYPRSPCGERRARRVNTQVSTVDFYPRSPCGERPSTAQTLPLLTLFLSTLSLRRATVCRPVNVTQIFNHFYPRSPCGERLMDTLILANAVLFLSTLSLRRATGYTVNFHTKTGISIHALLAESDARWKEDKYITLISIHALLAESDAVCAVARSPASQFLSTLSLRRATHYDNYNLHCVEISIHALLAESDRHRRALARRLFYKFLSTLSLRRATAWHMTCTLLWRHFYPRSPCGERHFDRDQ